MSGRGQPASGTAANSARRPSASSRSTGRSVTSWRDVVERRPHALRRAAGQRGPGQPVRGELHVQRRPAGRVGQRAGLPVDDRPAAVRVGVHRVHPPAHGDPVDHGLERHLHLVRLALRPPRRQERLLQLLEQLVRGGALVRGAGQLVDVEQLGGAEPLLEPGVERRAAAGVRVRAAAAAGGAGARRAPPGSAASSTSLLTDSCAGSATTGRSRAAARSASSTSTSAAQPSGSVRSSGSPDGRARRSSQRDARGAGIGGRRRGVAAAAARSAARTSSAPACTAADRAPSGSTGHSAVTGSAVAGLCAPDSGSSAQCSTRPTPVVATASRTSCEEHRRLPGPVAGRPPAVPGEQQHPLGPGERHVEQPPLLDQPALVEGLVVRRQRGLDSLAVGARRGRSSAGQVRGVAAQRDGQRRRVWSASVPLILRPGNTCATRCGTATISHSRPFAACTVSTWTRSGVTSTSPGANPSSAARRSGGSRAARAGSRPRRPRRSRRRRRRTRRGARGRRGRDGRRSRRRAGAARSASATRSVSGHRRPRAQPAQLAGEPADPGEARPASSGRAPPGSSSASTSPACSACSPGSAPSASSAGVRRAGRAAAARAPARGPGPTARRGRRRPAASARPVSSRTAAGPGERVGDQAQGADQVAHLRGVEQAAQPDHLDRQVARRAARRRRRPCRPGGARGRPTWAAPRRRPPPPASRGDRVGHPVDLRRDIGQQRDPHVARRRRPAPACSAPHADRTAGAAAAAARTRRSPAQHLRAGCGSS